MSIETRRCVLESHEPVAGEFATESNQSREGNPPFSCLSTTIKGKGNRVCAALMVELAKSVPRFGRPALTAQDDQDSE